MRMRSSVIIFFILLLTGTGRAVAQERNIWQANDSARIAEMFGSADVVTRERMNKGLVMNPITALGGQSAGLNVQSGGADRMAMLSSVRVRGTTSLTGGNDPLVIIDGVSADLATLSTIYPADIESFHSEECGRDCKIWVTRCVGCYFGYNEERSRRTVPNILRWECGFRIGL